MKKLSLILAVVMLLAVTASVTYLVTYHSVYRDAREEADELKQQYSDEFAWYSKLFEAVNAFKSNYIHADEMSDEELINWLITGYLYGTGDKYAAYYTAEEMQEMYSDLNGQSVGIGVMVVYNADQNAVQIVSVMPDSPALEAGVLPGDLIIYVGSGEERQSVASLGYELTLKAMTGEKGTIADFTVLRGAEELTFSIERRQVTSQSVTSRVYEADPTVGIVRILTFDNTAMVTQFRDAVNSLLASGCTRLVMDVRNNPGGLLTSIEAVLDMLLPEGPVIRTIDKAGREETVYTSDSTFLDVPIAVLVNGNTASAAELFSSALQDYAEKDLVRAVIVGTTTYGKGSMQTFLSLSDGSGVKVTYRLYCPPFSDNYDGVGVLPDVEVTLDEALAGKNLFLISDAEDNQLAAAVAALAS